MDETASAPALPKRPESSIDRTSRAAAFASVCLHTTLRHVRGEAPGEQVPFYCDVVEFRTEAGGGVSFSVTVDPAKFPDQEKIIRDFEPPS